MPRKKGSEKFSAECDNFFKKFAGYGLSYADALLIPQHSEVHPNDVDLTTRLSRNISLNCPIISSPMDTVTEAGMAVAMALAGGIGIIHCAMPIEEQARQVARVKLYLNGLINKPIWVNQEDRVEEVLQMIEEKNYRFRSFPVMNSDGKLVGLLTGNDFEFCPSNSMRVEEVMTRGEELITASDETSMEEAYEIMQQNKKKVLLLIDSQGVLAGMYVYSDLKRLLSGEKQAHNIDKNGNLRVGASIGVSENELERAVLLVDKGADVLVIDSAHGDTENVFRALKCLKERFRDEVDIIAGNVSIASAAIKLAKLGADGIRVGQGPGSICTTRVVAGAGRAQLTAVYECAKALRRTDIPVIADGGITYSGDITKALAAGASSAMLGRMLAEAKEAPGDTFVVDRVLYRKFRGMGSKSAMEENEASRKRYGQEGNEKRKLVPEGVEGAVPVRYTVSEVLSQIAGGIKSGMGYAGSKNIQELWTKAVFEILLPGAQKESSPHGIVMIRDAPNSTV